MDEAEFRQEFKKVYEDHWERLDDWARIEGREGPDQKHFVEVIFDCDGDEGGWIQFQWGLMNIAKLNEEKKTATHTIIEDEGLDIQDEGDVFILAFDNQLYDVERALALTKRTLKEAYGREIRDVVSIDEFESNLGFSLKKLIPSPLRRWL